MEGRSREFSPPVEYLKKNLEVASGTSGRISEVLMATDITRDGENSVYYDTLGDLKVSFRGQQQMVLIKKFLASLPEGVKLKIIVQEEGDGNSRRALEDLQESLRVTGIDPDRVETEIVESPEKSKSNVWLRDYMLMGADGKTVYAPRHDLVNDKGNNKISFVKDVAKKLGLNVVDCPFYFEGGDLRPDGDRLYVGASMLAHDIVLDQQTEKSGWPKIDIPNLKDKVKELQSFWGGEVVLVGEDYLERELSVSGGLFNLTDREKDNRYLGISPYHLDLYFTPLGHNQVAVGDVNLFLSLLKSEGGANGEYFLASLEESFRKLSEQAEGYPKDAFRKSTQKFSKDVMALLSSQPNYNYGQADRLKGIENARQYLDDVSSQMERMGLEVVRLPLMPIDLGGKVSSALITYNNSLVEDFEENGQEKRRIWLSTFGAGRRSRAILGNKRILTDVLDLVDGEARKILKKAGLQTVAIDSGLELTVAGGSINCCLMDIRK